MAPSPFGRNRARPAPAAWMLTAAVILMTFPVQAGDVPWLAEVTTAPANPPQDVAGRLDPLLVDAAGRPITTLDGWQRRRQAIGDAWREFLGPMPDPRPPVKLEVLSTELVDGVTRRLVRYEGEPGLPVEGYLLLPAGVEPGAAGPKRPGLVALHPTTNASIDEIAGVSGAPSQHLGLKLAARGWVVFCPRCFLWQDVPSLDEAVRRHRQRHPDTLGMAKMLYDAMRAVDVLQSLPEVDADRIGAFGHSLGAKETLYLAAFDERVKAAVASEGGTGLRSTNWDAPWYLGEAIGHEDFPLNHHQLLGLIAPRPFLILGGETGAAADGERTWPLVEAAWPVWQLYGGPIRLGLFNHRQGHTISPESFERIVQWLRAYLPPPSAKRPELQIINGSAQAVDVFWLETDSARVPNGSIAPGEDLVIATTIGHRFVVVGQQDHAEAYVSCQVPVQAFRFDPVPENVRAGRGGPGTPVPAGHVIAPPDGWGIPAYYSKFISADGYPIVASERVNDYALKEAAWLVNQLLAQRPDVRDAMIRSGSRLCILAHDEFTTDLPEFAHPAAPGERVSVSAKDYWDARARGTGGSDRDPYCSCGEENLLAYPGDPYAAENILIHEFAHNIHLRGLANVDSTFDARVKEAYGRAMARGLWKGTYASVNHHEYFAEGVQSWFDNNRENDHDHNHVNTRAELCEYDPDLAALCREVLGDTVLKYTKPTTRLTGHLAGYDPTTAPTFAWPERLRQAHDEILRNAVERSRSAKGGKK